jgi:hypothetical protein
MQSEVHITRRIIQALQIIVSYWARGENLMLFTTWIYLVIFKAKEQKRLLTRPASTYKILHLLLLTPLECL